MKNGSLNTLWCSSAVFFQHLNLICRVRKKRATAVGILPLTTLMVVLGDQLHTLPWQIWLVVFASGLLLWFVMRRLFGVKKQGKADATGAAEKPLRSRDEYG